MGYLEFLAKTYPNLCSIQDIGHTKEGRPLRVLRVSNGDPRNAAIWIDGGIHAREWISPAVVTYIIDQFAVKWEVQPAFVQSVDWYIAETNIRLHQETQNTSSLLCIGTSCPFRIRMATNIPTPPIDCGARTAEDWAQADVRVSI